VQLEEDGRRKPVTQEGEGGKVVERKSDDGKGRRGDCDGLNLSCKNEGDGVRR